MSSLWLPETLYRSLPAVYAVTGFGLLLMVRGNVFAMISALLLIVAGVLVTLWRFRHRATASSSVSAREAFYRRKRQASVVSLTHI